MNDFDVHVLRSVSGRESVGNDGTIPVSGRERVGNDGTIPVRGRERVGNDGTVLNSGQRRLGQGLKNFGLSPVAPGRQWLWFSSWLRSVS